MRVIGEARETTELSQGQEGKWKLAWPIILPVGLGADRSGKVG